MKRVPVLIWAILLIAPAIRTYAQSTTAPSRSGSSSPSTQPAAIVVNPPAKDSFDIYLLMGQSNMVGRDTSTLALQMEHPRILSLNGAGQWTMAKDPLHEDARIPPGVGPGLSFAVEMLKANPNRTIGLVPCSVGGTPLSRWVKGADLYEKAVSRAKLAAQAGVIKGMIWHQGESDTNTPTNANTYESRLIQMFKDLRQDLNSPDLPIVVGQLGEYLTVEKYPSVETVRKTLRNMPNVLPAVGYADAAGLHDKGDQLHFNADSQVQFGQRYAKAMQELLKK